MAKMMCRMCQSWGAKRFLVSVTIEGKARQWRVVTCRDCWRAFEGTLDLAAASVQPDLPYTSSGRPLREPFLW